MLWLIVYQQHSRPPTPQRKFGPPPDLSATPPGTPGYSDRPSSAGSTISVSAPPSPVAPTIPAPLVNKFFSQRGIESQTNSLSSPLYGGLKTSSESLGGIAAKRPSVEGLAATNNSTSLSNKILKAAAVFQHDDDEIEDDDIAISSYKAPVLKDLSTAAEDDEFDF